MHASILSVRVGVRMLCENDVSVPMSTHDSANEHASMTGAYKFIRGVAHTQLFVMNSRVPYEQ